MLADEIAHGRVVGRVGFGWDEGEEEVESPYHRKREDDKWDDGSLFGANMRIEDLLICNYVPLKRIFPLS